MSYIGNSITQQSFTGGVDQYNGNNSNTAFGLTRTINTVYDVDVYVENVWQRPTTGYTVSANTITFTSAPPAGSNNVVVVYRNFAATSVIPQQGSVTTTSFAANAIPATLGYIPANQAGDTFTGTVTANTLVVSTNTATIGTTLYAVSNGGVYVGTSTSPSNGTKFLSYATLDQSGVTVNATNASQTNDILLIRAARNTTGGSYNAFTVYNDTAGAYRFQLTDGGNIGLFGGQIKFPASQSASSDANTLDDYEEGTWTPTYGGNSTYTSNQYGIYTKIGNIVTVHFDVTVNTIGTGDGSVLRGFPFQSGNSMPQGGTITYYQSANVSIVSFLIYMIGNASYAYFVGNGSASSSSQNNGGVFVTNGTRVAGTVTYRTT